MANLDLPDRRESSDSLEYMFALSKEPEKEGDEEQRPENCFTPRSESMVIRKPAKVRP